MQGFQDRMSVCESAVLKRLFLSECERGACYLELGGRTRMSMDTSPAFLSTSSA